MNTIDDYFNPEKYERTLFKVFREIFSGTIKESFLISMFSKVEHNPRYLEILSNKLNGEPLFSIEASIRGRNTAPINICKMIVMCHYMNVVRLSDSERTTLQNSDSYKEQLANEVLDMFAVENLAASNFNKSSIEPYMPLIFYISAINNYCASVHDWATENKVEVSKPYNNEFNMNLLHKIIMKVKSCIVLADLASTDDLIVVFRSFIELLMTYFVLWDQNEEVLKKFELFDSATFQYNAVQTIPDEMKCLMDEFRVEEKHMVKFINYGWLYYLDEYKKVFKGKNSFSLSRLAKILDVKYGHLNETFGSDLYAIYRACNPQTHGTSLTMNYLELELHIFKNIGVAYKYLIEIISKKFFSFKLDFTGIDLLNKLNASLDQAGKVYMWINGKEERLYKTNIDYRNRVLSSIKLRS